MVAEGTILGGRYRLYEPIGDGGMARVFRAEDERLSRIVAVKVLHQQYRGQPDFIRRFEQEARLAASLSHPNVVAIYDVNREGAIDYIVMEYVAGGSLKQVLRRSVPLPLERVVAVTRQLGLALDAAHAQGIIHRDIKPENILLTDSGQVKVGDFGIARALASSGQTVTGMVMGSASYFAPEQAQGRPASAESDLYSSGVVLYEMLTGRLPFVADNPLATAMQHVTQTPLPPRSITPALPPAIDGVILQALDKDPARRFHTGAALADAVAAAVGTRSAGAAQTMPGAATGAIRRGSMTTYSPRKRRPTTVPTRRRPLRALAVPLVLLLAGGSAVLAMAHAGRIQRLLAGAFVSATPPPSASQTPRHRSEAPGAAASARPSSAAGRSGSTPGTTASPAVPTASKGRPVVAPPSHPNGDIVVAHGYGRDSAGIPYPLQPSDTFTGGGRTVYAIMRFHALVRGAHVAVQWTFPDGSQRAYDRFAPAYGSVATYWAAQGVTQPGRYTVTVLVNGHVVGSHVFRVQPAPAHAATTGAAPLSALNGDAGGANGTGKQKHGHDSGD